MMSEELKILLKTLTMRMVDALGIWRDESAPDKIAEPSWAEKEVAIVNYMSSKERINVLIDTVQGILDAYPDVHVFRYVTRGFVSSTLGLLRDYRDCEFEEHGEATVATPVEGAPGAAGEKNEEGKGSSTPTEEVVPDTGDVNETK